MTLKEFLQDKTVTAVELVDIHGNQIINVYVGSACYGLRIDTTNLVSGTPLEYRTDVVVDGDLISVGDVVLDTNTVDML